MEKSSARPPKKLGKIPDDHAGFANSSQPNAIELDRTMSISQFAHTTGISRSALIYYDEMGIFHPAKRDPKNNYRYYRPEQIITANLIKVLAELNIPLKQIKKLSTQRTAEGMIDLFEKHRDTLQEHVEQLQLSIQLIEVFHNLLTMSKHADETAVEVMTLPVWDIVVGPKTGPFTEKGNFYQPFLEFCAWAQQQGHSINFPTGGYFSSFETFYDHPGEPDNFFLLRSTNPDPTDTVKVLTAYSRGFYGQVGDIAERMAQALKKEGLEPDGRLLCIFIEDEISTVDPSRYLMQATLRVR